MKSLNDRELNDDRFETLGYNGHADDYKVDIKEIHGMSFVFVLKYDNAAYCVADTLAARGTFGNHKPETENTHKIVFDKTLNRFTCFAGVLATYNRKTIDILENALLCFNTQDKKSWIRQLLANNILGQLVIPGDRIETVIVYEHEKLIKMTGAVFAKTLNGYEIGDCSDLDITPGEQQVVLGSYPNLKGKINIEKNNGIEDQMRKVAETVIAYDSIQKIGYITVGGNIEFCKISL